MQFHMLTLFRGYPPHFKQQESPFPSSFAKPFIGSTAYRLSAIRRFPFLAAKHSPSCRQRKRSLGFARDDDTGNVLSSFLLPCIGYSSRRPSFRAQREIFFVTFFPRTPSLSRLREAPSPPFLRYGVSRFSLLDTRPLAANEKDPSASLGMTIRETCFLNTIFSRSTEMPISRLFTSLSFISRL